MNHQTTHTEHQFDIWLDAYVAGMSTPASRAASDSVPGDIRDTARQFHTLAGLAHGAERSPTLPPFAPTWEDFMHAQPASLSPIAHPETRRAADLVSAPPLSTAHNLPVSRPIARHRPAWDRAFSTALVAAIVLALATGIWRASDGMPFSSGDGPPDSPGIPFGGQVAQDESDPVVLPTAEDCTVEPLTVDEVIWYIQSPLEALYSTDVANPGPLPTEVVLATPPATNPPNFEQRPATPEELAGAAETQRMLMACVLADSYFQIWALFEPFWVQDFIMASLPPLTGEDGARAILEELEETGTAGEGPRYGFGLPSEIGFLGIIPDGGAELLDTDPANSWSEAEGHITVGYITYDADGTLVATTNMFANREGTPVAIETFSVRGGSPCYSYSLTWNEARAMWLIQFPPACG